MRRVIGAVASLSLAVGVVQPAGTQASVAHPVALASQTVTMRLQPVAPARAHGTATLTAVGAGTRVVLDVRGLPPRARALSALHGGTCSHFGLSTTVVVALRADATGRARAAGRLLFHGKQNIRLSVLTDADHVLVIVLAGHIVACGTFPRASARKP
ncbi:MAG TPA: hypothetical protein VKF37_02765 [Chloroflexota bacterium]|nr:hypothetical protein [Chloroflexota bacterium]